MSGLILVAIAEIAADPISGGSGWVGAGLLGAVLAWLCGVYLPAKDKQVRDLISDFRASLERQEVSHQQQQMETRKQADAERAECWKSHDKTNERLQAVETQMVLLRQQSGNKPN